MTAREQNVVSLLNEIIEIVHEIGPFRACRFIIFSKAGNV